MGIALAILWITMLVVLVCAAVVAIRQLWGDAAKVLKRPRFGVVDLFLLMTVLCTGAAAVRWFWNSPYLGIVLLVIPMVMPFAWLVKFGIEDARLHRQKRRQRAEAIVTNFEVPSAEDRRRTAEPRMRNRRKKPSRTWMPPLSPLSLSQKPLDTDD